MFARDGTTWSQQAYLKASNTDAYDGFGGSVAIASDTLVVGAHWEASAATGVNGDQSDNTADAFVRARRMCLVSSLLRTYLPLVQR